MIVPRIKTFQFRSAPSQRERRGDEIGGMTWIGFPMSPCVVRKLSACKGKLRYHPVSNEVYYAIFRSPAAHKIASKADLLKNSQEFEDDHNNDNYSDYIEDASVHTGGSYQSERAVARIYPD